jgi:hypothetical protein
MTQAAQLHLDVEGTHIDFNGLDGLGQFNLYSRIGGGYCPGENSLDPERIET